MAVVSILMMIIMMEVTVVSITMMIIMMEVTVW